MATVLFVRAKSNLDPAELDKRLLERRPRFLDVPGLVQKIYGRDESTGDVCGIYFFEDQDALSKYRETELAKTIPTAYEVTEIRMETYEVLYPLHPDRGPISE
jgi:Putative mono-oxygenase ydhR